MILYCLLWGVISSLVSYCCNTLFIEFISISSYTFSGFIAPFIEEGLKCLLLWFFIKKNKIGFMIDGGIYGFAIGAAFSLVENLFYLFLYSSQDNYLLLWIIRGFGTAIMHGGATSIIGIIAMGALNRKSNLPMALGIGLVSAIFLHGCYNQFLHYSVYSSLFIACITPLVLILVFNKNEKSLTNWLELEFDSEVKMLGMIKKGQFTSTKTGNYLLGIRTHFTSEIVMDMYCYITLYLELSLKAKSLLMLQEAGIVVKQDKTIPSKLSELIALRKQIGQGGMLAIKPVLKMNSKDLWKLSLLGYQE